MQKFEVHTSPDEYGRLDPRGWKIIEAETPEAAIVEGMKRDGTRPEMGFIALGSFRHKNGGPLCVQMYSITYQKKEELCKH